MDWNVVLSAFAGRPLFHSSMLDIFPDPRHHKQVQLSRWTKAGKLSQIRRGWYLIRGPGRTGEVPLGVIANKVVHPSYLSLEWAMQYYGMIPEHVPNPTSVTTGRGLRFTALDTLFLYYHIQPSLFKGYRKETFGGNTYDIAYPEKALFDKVYLFMQRNPFSIEWFRELRLQNLEEFDLERFRGFAAETKHKKYRDAIERASRFIVDDRGDA